ncbi:hypothetical protein M422DRAFT_245491 [Sphaerobolus stellatus SS14]|nr:hypothetical protein M422DRAFT_245491 [Sphaerobolus stellatus SS14]
MRQLPPCYSLVLELISTLGCPCTSFWCRHPTSLAAFKILPVAADSRSEPLEDIQGSRGQAHLSHPCSPLTPLLPPTSRFKTFLSTSTPSTGSTRRHLHHVIITAVNVAISPSLRSTCRYPPIAINRMDSAHGSRGRWGPTPHVL